MAKTLQERIAVVRLPKQKTDFSSPTRLTLFSRYAVSYSLGNVGKAVEVVSYHSSLFKLEQLHLQYVKCVCSKLFHVRCSILFLVVVVVVDIVGAMFIYSCHFEDTSSTLVIYLCMSQWYDNDNPDLPQHVTRLVKWGDDVDGNKCRSVIILSIPVTDTVSMCTCITRCFHSVYCMLQASQLRSTVACKMGIFIAGVNHTFENTSLVFLIKWKYQITFKIPTKISEIFPVFPWCLQTTAEIVH